MPPIVGLVLGLYGVDKRHDAERLLLELSRYLDSTAAARVLPSRVLVQLHVAKELSGLRDDAGRFRRVVAHAALTGDWLGTERRLNSMAQFKGGAR